jgi:hypothetical protein
MSEQNQKEELVEVEQQERERRDYDAVAQNLKIDSSSFWLLFLLLC